MELLNTKATHNQSPNSSFLCLKLPYYQPKKEITCLYKTLFPSQTFNNLKLHKNNSKSFSSTCIDFSNEHLKKCIEYQTNNSINIETPFIEPEIEEEEKFEAIKPKYHQNSITPALTPRLPLNDNTTTKKKGNNIPIVSRTSRVIKTTTNFHKQSLNNADMNIVNYNFDKKSSLDEESNYNKYLNLYKQYNKAKLNKIKISNTNKLFYDVFFGNKSNNTKYKEGFNEELMISNKLNKSSYNNGSYYVDHNNKPLRIIKVNKVNLNNKTNFNIKQFKQHSFCYSLSSNVFPDSYYSINNSNCCSNKLMGGKITFRSSSSSSSRKNNKDKVMKCLNKKKQNGNKLNVYEIDTKSIPNTSIRFNCGNSNSNYYNNLAYNVVIRSMKNYVNEKLGRLKLSNSFVTQTKYKEREFITINNYSSSGKLINKKLFK